MSFSLKYCRVAGGKEVFSYPSVAICRVCSVYIRALVPPIRGQKTISFHFCTKGRMFGETSPKTYQVYGPLQGTCSGSVLKHILSAASKAPCRSLGISHSLNHLQPPTHTYQSGSNSVSHSQLISHTLIQSVAHSNSKSINHLVSHRVSQSVSHP